MALNYYTNWGPLHHLNQELPLPPELLNFHDNYYISDTCIGPLFDKNNFFYPINETIPSPLPQPQILDSYPYPKRIKSQENFYYHDNFTIRNSYDYFDNIFVPNPPLLPEFSPEFVVPMPEFQPGSTSNIVMPQAYGTCGSITSSNADSSIKGTVTSNNFKGNGSGSLSAQSMAARLRRRKITGKTQELGKLIPGGHKMNTAEMFQAASKYIKFLQAQVGMLEFMGLSGDNQEKKEGLYSPQLHDLVTSPLVQEKLYSADKCLVRRKFVETLSENREIQSNPRIIKDKDQLYGVLKIREYCLDILAFKLETFADSKEFRAMLLTLPPPSGDPSLRTTVPNAPGAEMNLDEGNILDDLREKWLEAEAAELDQRDESALLFDKRLDMLMLVAEKEKSSADNDDN